MIPALSGRGDVVGTSVFAFLFTLCSGMASVALPLIALGSGLGAAEVGVAATASGLVQIASRSSLGFAMRHVSDRAVLLLGAVAQLASFTVLLFSGSFAVLTTAWILQGLARSCFWTGVQTHVVRRRGNAVGALAFTNFVGGVGVFAGPLFAGTLASLDLSLALLAGATVSVMSILIAAALERHLPFSRTINTPTRKILREPGMRTACWAGVGAGTWRSILESFIPIVLDGARYSPTAIGALVSVSNGAAVLGALAVGRMRQAIAPMTYAVTMLASAAGFGTIGFVATSTPAAASALALSGFAAGMLQTISPALATTSVRPHEQGDAIAMAGTARAVAMFAAPLLVTAAALAVPVGVGLLGVGLALCVPAVTVARRV